MPPQALRCNALDFCATRSKALDVGVPPFILMVEHLILACCISVVYVAAAVVFVFFGAVAVNVHDYLFLRIVND